MQYHGALSCFVGKYDLCFAHDQTDTLAMGLGRDSRCRQGEGFTGFRLKAFYEGVLLKLDQVPPLTLSAIARSA